MEGTADREQLYSDFSEVPSEAAAESSDMGQLLSIPLTEGQTTNLQPNTIKENPPSPSRSPRK
jgi:hypothetical protein